MKSKEEEFKEIFLAEALDQYEELNRLFTILEKNHHDKPTVEAIFRTTHTLKANAASMGFEAIANMAHVLEDIFSEIKNERMMLTPHVFAELFRANDKLGELIHSIKTGESISYKGLMAKLKVILQRGKEAAEKQKNNHHPPIAETPSTPEVEPSSLKSPLQQEMVEAEKKEEMPVPPTDYTSSSLVETKSDSEDLAPPLQNQPIETDFGSLLEENGTSSVAESENQKETESPLEIAPKEVIHEDVKVELSESTISAKSEPSVSTEKNERVQQAQEEKEKEEIKTPQITFSDLVQVPVKKLDNLLNLVGELAIEKDRLMASNRNVSELASLHRITSDLQYSVMGVRLVQVSVLFQKFHRIVRDVALYENKKVNLVLEGTEVEIDRNILQIISDSMIHLVRNAISHGIELPSERVAIGKSEVGTLRLKARNEKDHVVIDVEDDGRGINPDLIRRKAIEKGMLSPLLSQKMTDDEVMRFIFEPGFSSAEKVTDISGRGVGMDVVRKSIEAIGGKILMSSQVGKGTRFSLSLPASMAVKSVLLFELQGAEFAIPLSFTEAVISLKKSDIHKVGAGLMATYQDKTMSVVFLNDIFHAAESHLHQRSFFSFLHRSFEQLQEETKVYIIVVSMYNYLVGFVVDKLLQQKEILERPLKPPVDNAKFISGATIMGNGNVCLVLDVNALVDFLFKATSASAEMNLTNV